MSPSLGAMARLRQMRAVAAYRQKLQNRKIQERRRRIIEFRERIRSIERSLRRAGWRF